MQPKRTEIINYYDCYEVGYVKLYCTGQGDPDGRNTSVIIRTLNKQGVEDLAKKYNINFVDYDNWYATGFYIREVEITEDMLSTGKVEVSSVVHYFKVIQENGVDKIIIEIY